MAGTKIERFDVDGVVVRLDEEHAIQLFHTMVDRFGWTGTFWNRDDAEGSLGGKLTEAEWEKLSMSTEWETIADVVAEYAPIYDALEQVIPEAIQRVDPDPTQEDESVDPDRRVR